MKPQEVKSEERRLCAKIFKVRNFSFEILRVMTLNFLSVNLVKYMEYRYTTLLDKVTDITQCSLGLQTTINYDEYLLPIIYTYRNL